MNCFFTKNELKGTDCHEFFAGEWDGRFWNDDSIYITDDEFRESGLRTLLRQTIPDYSPYDATEIFPEDWDRLCAAAGTKTAAVMKEAEDWVRSAFREHGSFTILGI